MELSSLVIFMIFNTMINGGKAFNLRRSIVGGDDAQENEYNYQVSLTFEDKNICGGGIIGDQFILTAAHCVIDGNGQYIQYILTAMIDVIDINNPRPTAIKITAELIYVPKEYKPQYVRHDSTYRPTGDIAVLKLKESIREGIYTQLTKLERPNDLSSTYENEEATITGFGYNTVILETDPVTKQQYEVGESTGKMRYAITKVIPNSECVEIFVQTVHSSNLCAKMKQRLEGKPEGVCNGDSGSPLVHNGTTVIGILSSSPLGCDEVKGAGVYTRVTSFGNFIKNALNGVKTPNMRLGTWYMFNELYECDNLSPMLIES